MKKKIIITLVVLIIVGLISVFTLYSAGVSQLKSIEWVKSNNGDVEFEIKGWAKSIPFEGAKNFIGKQITAASISDATLENLTKLEVFIDCEALKIEGCTISNYSSIAKLKGMKKLYFFDSNIKDLKFLEDLENLEHLELTNSSVVDLSPLARFRKLKTIKLKGCEVKDIVLLRKLEQLEVIDLSATKVENILPLQSLKKLTNLYLEQTSVTESQVTHLQKILPNCKITYTSDKL